MNETAVALIAQGLFFVATAWAAHCAERACRRTQALERRILEVLETEASAASNAEGVHTKD